MVIHRSLSPIISGDLATSRRNDLIRLTPYFVLTTGVCVPLGLSSNSFIRPIVQGVFCHPHVDLMRFYYVLHAMSIGIDILAGILPSLFLQHHILRTLSSLFHINASSKARTGSTTLTTTSINGMFTLRRPNIPRRVRPAFPIQVIHFLLRLLGLESLHLSFNSNSGVFPTRVSGLAPTRANSFTRLSRFVII